MKAMDVHVGIYRLRREKDGSYEFECKRCLHKIDLDQRGDPHVRWRRGGSSLLETCPNPL